MLAVAVFDFKHGVRFNFVAAETAKRKDSYSSLDVLSKYELKKSLTSSDAKLL